MNFSEQIDVTWFNFTQMPAVVASSNSAGGLYIKLSNSESSLDVHGSPNNNNEISSMDSTIARYNKKTGERTYLNSAYINAFNEITHTFTDYSSWFTPPYSESYALPRIMIAFTFTKVVVEKTDVDGQYNISGGFSNFNYMVDSYGNYMQYVLNGDYRTFTLPYNGDYRYNTIYKYPQTGYSFYCNTSVRITDYNYSFLGMTPIVQNGRCYGVLSYSDDIVLQHITIKDPQDVVRQIVNGNMVELINYDSLSQTYSYNGYEKTLQSIAVRGITPVFSCYFDKTTSKIIIERTENCDGVLMQLYTNESELVDETLGNEFNINKKGAYTVSNKQVDVLYSMKTKILTIDYTSTFIISVDDAMLAVNNPDEDIESVDLYCDGVFIANIK